MNSLYSAQQVINLIVKQSKQKIKQNNLVKTMIIPYTTTLSQTNRNDAVLHAGTHFDRSTNNFFKHQVNSEQKPKNSIKDTYSFFSMKKTKLQRKQNCQLSLPKQQSPKKTSKNFFKSTGFNSKATSHKQRSITKNKQTSEKSTIQIESLKETFYIKLQDPKKQMTKFIQKQQNQINYLRQIKNNDEDQKQTQRKRDQSNSQNKTARQKKISAQLESHLSKPNNHYTYDINGALLLCNAEANKKAIGKVYPPGMRYEVENDQDYDDFTENRNNLTKNRNRAYSNLQIKKKDILLGKGEIFKSSVLKTINLSRISMGNQHLDETQFMKRNDLFNNNHSRQTTSIPFLKMEGGTAFKQTATNQSISNKEVPTQTDSGNIKQTINSMKQSRARSHDTRARKQFKKFSLKQDFSQNFNIKLDLQSGKKVFSNGRKSFQRNKSIGDSRYSSFYIQRPNTTQIGRIKRQNVMLFHSMLEEN